MGSTTAAGCITWSVRFILLSWPTVTPKAFANSSPELERSDNSGYPIRIRPSTLKGFANGTLSGLNAILLKLTQGCRCAPTAGLKLANAFGVALSNACGAELTNAFGVELGNACGAELANAIGVELGNACGADLANAFGVELNGCHSRTFPTNECSKPVLRLGGRRRSRRPRPGRTSSNVKRPVLMHATTPLHPARASRQTRQAALTTRGRSL